MTTESICELASKIAELALALGEAPLHRHEGAWTHRLNEHWWLAANGHKQPVSVEPEGAMRIDLDPYHFAVWWHGWLAGMFNPYGGTLAAHPDGANEHRLLADLDVAIAAAQKAVQ